LKSKILVIAPDATRGGTDRLHDVAAIAETPTVEVALSTPGGYGRHMDDVSHAHPPGYHGDKAAVLSRLRKVEGQVRGIERMVENDTYCIDVMTQIAAVTKALQGIGVLLLEDHMGHCMARAAAEHDHERSDELVTEASAAVRRLLRA
jgi:DNA-binding FrmR family transcriptional regulator